MDEEIELNFTIVRLRKEIKRLTLENKHLMLQRKLVADTLKATAKHFSQISKESHDLIDKVLKEADEL